MTEGETGLILHVPEAESVVGPWRSRHDSSAPLGVPAHVTVLYPWIPIELVTDDDRAAVAEIVASMGPLELTFGGFGRFPDVLWLDPRPSEPILALTRAMARVPAVRRRVRRPADPASDRFRHARPWRARPCHR